MILMQYWHFPHNATLPQSKKHLLLQIKILSELLIYSSILPTPTTKCLLYDKGTINKHWFLSSRLTVWYNCFIQSHVNIHVSYVANFVARYMIDYIRGFKTWRVITTSNTIILNYSMVLFWHISLKILSLSISMVIMSTCNVTEHYHNKINISLEMLTLCNQLKITIIFGHIVYCKCWTSSMQFA